MTLKPCYADLLNDLSMFDPLLWHWTQLTDLSVKGHPPSPRASFGMAGAAGKLYIFGGVGLYGRQRVSISGRVHCALCIVIILVACPNRRPLRFQCDYPE